jgi:small conductance mechanosensitive channel
MGTWDVFFNKITLEVPQISLKIVETIDVLMIAGIIGKFGKRLIIGFFNKQKNLRYKIDERRSDTLGTLLASIFKYTIYTITILTIINSIFEVNISTILTAAGIGGIAIGFGAQSLVKDVISGFFILLEDQFAVGDTITIDQMSGTVEEMEMRITKIRHFNGDLFIVPNGEIKKVTNHTRGNKAAIVDVKIAYNENLDRVIEILNDTVSKISKEFETILEEPQVLGITEFTPNDITIRVITKTVANEQYAVERELRKRIKEAFDREGIIIPHNKKVIITTNDNDYENNLLK